VAGTLSEFFLQPLRDCEAERRAWDQSFEKGRVDWEVVMVMLTAALLMTVQYYGLYRGTGIGWLMQITGKTSQIWQRTFWALGQSAVYVVVPVTLIWLMPNRRLKDYGVKLRNPLAYWWAYVLMYVGLLPAVIAASRIDQFRNTYPFYRLQVGEPLWPHLVAWEVVYAAQFIALEFFFRGFLLHGTRRRFGAYAILVMTVPYCMIHFGKPVQETVGSIVAGLLLGFMSLKTRSIWLGAALHIAVAWTMDAIALIRAGYDFY
jgi:membrane protease YdiL (CAAX protease family)